MNRRLDDIETKLDSLSHLADVVTEKYEKNAKKTETANPDDLMLVQVREIFLAY